MILTRGAEIHLDTSFLIHALVPGSSEGNRLRAWHEERRIIGMSAFALGEFLCGPLEPGHAELARRLVLRYRPLGIEEAAAGAELFNRTGRRRGSFPDCLIAATAIMDGGALATSNPRDFRRFAEAGLDLVG